MWTKKFKMREKQKNCRECEMENGDWKNRIVNTSAPHLQFGRIETMNTKNKQNLWIIVSAFKLASSWIWRWRIAGECIERKRLLIDKCNVRQCVLKPLTAKSVNTNSILNAMIHNLRVIVGDFDWKYHSSGHFKQFPLDENIFVQKSYFLRITLNDTLNYLNNVKMAFEIEWSRCLEPVFFVCGWKSTNISPLQMTWFYWLWLPLQFANNQTHIFNGFNLIKSSL